MADAAFYVVQLNQLPTVTVTVASFTVTDELAEGVHTLTVTTVDAAGNESDLAAFEFEVELVPPASPENLEVVHRSSTSIGLSWTPVPDAVVYEVRSDIAVDGTFAKVEYRGSASEYEVTALSAGTTYYFVVVAENQWGSGDPSLVVQGRTRLEAPANLTAGDGTRDGDVRLDWESVDGADEYVVFRGATPAGSFSEIDRTADPGYNDDTAVPETTYYYMVAADSIEYGLGEMSDPDEGWARPPRAWLTIINETPYNFVDVFVDGYYVDTLNNFSAGGGVQSYSDYVLYGVYELYAERPYEGYYRGPVSVTVGASGYTWRLR